MTFRDLNVGEKIRLVKVKMAWKETYLIICYDKIQQIPVEDTLIEAVGQFIL
jgi:hypothetical protein